MQPTKARPLPTRGTALLLLGLLGALVIGLGLGEAWGDSPTYDEGIYVASGVTALTRHDLRLNQEHPPLAKALAAAPVLAARPEVPRGRAWERADEHAYADRFLRAQLTHGKLRRVMLLARLVPLIETVVAGFAVYALAAGLFGRGAGVLAGALWLASPVTLGLGHLDGIDIPFALTTVAVCLALRRHLARPRGSTLVVAGLACGAALLVRHSGLLLLPVAAVAVATAGWRPNRKEGLRAAATVVVIAWMVVWAGYRAIAPVPSHTGCARSSAAKVALAVVPREYACGVGRLVNVSKTPARAFLLGRSWTGSRWWFWPGSMLVKLPPPTLVVLALAPLAWTRIERATRRRALVTVLVPGVVLALATAFQPRPLGVRYLLPVLALWLVAASPLAHAVRTRSGAAIAVAVVAGALGATVTSFPHSISWTAPFLRPGYRVATDSNLDWGQDLYRLQAWSRGRRPWVAYFGPRGLARAGPPSRALEGAEPSRVRGWVAASATLLTGDGKDRLAWLRAYCPVRTLGGSILLYRIERPPRAAAAPVAPPRLCGRGTRSSTRR